MWKSSDPGRVPCKEMHPGSRCTGLCRLDLLSALAHGSWDGLCNDTERSQCLLLASPSHRQRGAPREEVSWYRPLEGIPGALVRDAGNAHQSWTVGQTGCARAGTVRRLVRGRPKMLWGSRC